MSEEGRVHAIERGEGIYYVAAHFTFAPVDAPVVREVLVRDDDGKPVASHKQVQKAGETATLAIAALGSGFQSLPDMRNVEAYSRPYFGQHLWMPKFRDLMEMAEWLGLYRPTYEPDWDEWGDDE